jgi:hypothetical protein
LKQTTRGGFERVLYGDLKATLGADEINPESLAQLAIASMRNSPTRNAIRDLAQNIDQGIVPPLSYSYIDAILRSPRR